MFEVSVRPSALLLASKRHSKILQCRSIEGLRSHFLGSCGPLLAHPKLLNKSYPEFISGIFSGLLHLKIWEESIFDYKFLSPNKMHNPIEKEEEQKK